MGKFLEIFFRHKLLLLLPPVLITVIATAVTIYTSPLLYVSTAGIWVDKATYLAYTDNWNAWASPAQNQTSRLTELLKTQAFVTDVAKRTSLAPLTNSSRGLDRIQTTISQGLGMAPIGTHLVAISFRAESPQIAYQMLTAVVQGFTDNIANDQVDQASLATSFYTDQLAQAQVDLTKSSDDLSRYVQSNPRLNSLQFSSAPESSKAMMDQISATDPTLAQLRSQVQTNQDRVTQIRGSLLSSEFQASASVEGQQLGFQVVDAPNLPTVGGRDLKKRLIYPIGALVLSVAFSGLMLVLFALADRSVRSEADLVSGVRVIGDVPHLRLRKIVRSLGPVAARRAIGFVAGAALPAPRGAK